jgi:hypothetical protein
MSESKKAGNKANGAVIIKRVEKVVQLLLEGRSRIEVCQHATKKWKVSTRQADRYIKKAKERIEDGSNESVEHLRKRAFKRFDMLIQKALKAGNLAEARRAMEAQNRMHGFDRGEYVEDEQADGSYMDAFEESMKDIWQDDSK